MSERKKKKIDICSDSITSTNENHFFSLEVVGRGSDTQLQVGKNSNTITI